MSGPETKFFTKDDYLSPIQVAQKFKESQQLVEKLMKDLCIKKKTFQMGIFKRLLVIDAKYSHKKNELRLHPMGQDVFKELLEQKKAKLEKLAQGNEK